MEQLQLPFGRQLQLPAMERSPEPARCLEQAETGGAVSDTTGADPDRRGHLASRPAATVGPPSELAAELERQEWAADGGDGYVLSLDLEEPSALNLEWMLHGALIEAMAAVLMRAPEARSIELEESEKKPEVAE